MQQSRNVFTVELWDRQELSQRYPEAAAVPPRDGLPLTRYVREESFSDSEKVPVIDWYYKKPVLTEGDDGAWYEEGRTALLQICRGNGTLQQRKRSPGAVFTGTGSTRLCSTGCF